MLLIENFFLQSQKTRDILLFCSHEKIGRTTSQMIYAGEILIPTRSIICVQFPRNRIAVLVDPLFDRLELDIRFLIVQLVNRIHQLFGASGFLIILEIFMLRDIGWHIHLNCD